MTTRNEDDDSDHFEDALDEIQAAESDEKCSDKDPADKSATERLSKETSDEFDILLNQDTDGDDDGENSSSEKSTSITDISEQIASSDSNDSPTKYDKFCQEEFVKHSEQNLNSGDNVEVNFADNDDKDCETEIVIDEEDVRQKEALLSEEEREERRSGAQEMKEKGNTEFKAGNFKQAIEHFTSALTMCPMCYDKDRSVMYSNRGASKYRLEKYETCIADCSKALELNPHYLKALLRRAECYEKTEKLDEALEDYTKSLEFDQSLLRAREACMRLPEEIKVRNEKMKEEMMEKLKGLGNMVLRPFGLSTSNFKFNQDPNTGSYSMNFVQNAANGDP